MSTVLAIVGGLVLLVLGGELLVRGAGSLARTLGMAPLIVGLTVVAFSTSAPELAVTLEGVTSGSPELAIGNVVGSSIANILLVLGLSALILPLAVQSRIVRFDIPVMIGMAVALLVVAWDLQISRIEAGVLFVLLVGYVVQVLTMARRGRIDPAQDIELAPPIAAVPHGTAQEPLPGSFAAEHPQEVRAGRSDPPGPQDAEHGKGPADTLAPAAAAGLVVAGVVLLVVGSSLLVEGARTVAESFGVSELVIGLTVVAIGTSLPELATSMLAAVRGERDLAVGNVVGSNIFNVGAVLGISGLLAGPLPVPPSAVALDIPLVILSGLILLPLALTSSSIGRLEGALLVAGYLAYTLYLYLDASGHERLEPFSALMLQVVIPTVLVIIAVGYLADRRRPR